MDLLQAIASAASASSRAKANGGDLRQAMRPQRVKVLTMAQWLTCSNSPAHALWRSHRERGLTMTAIAASMSKSVARVSRTIAMFEDSQVA